MTTRFNLLDEPWLTVRFCDGEVRDIGLLELFAKLEEISELAETSPPSLIAGYRLLLAITHRALSHHGGVWKDKDRARWYRDGFPVTALHDYLEHWRDRFWMFHPEMPFMQVAALMGIEETQHKQKPWTQVSLASANGNMPIMFDHSCDLEPEPITPAAAMRVLLGFLQCTPGGLVKTIKTSDKAGPLANTAGVLPMGGNLQQTLCLALHPARGREDVPSWERPPLERLDLTAPPSLATGPNDRYSRLSRAVLFDHAGDDQVRWLRLAVGDALLEDANAPDPMASYRAGFNRMERLGFTEGRAFWRDLPALVPDAEGKASQPAAVLGWAANLNAYLDSRQVDQPLLVAGVASDQAKLLRWRSERLFLPANLLENVQLAGFLRGEIQRAESLHDRIEMLAKNMLAECMPEPHRKDTQAQALKVVATGGAAAKFFASVERSVPMLLQYISAGDGDKATHYWSACLAQAAEECWQVLRREAGYTPSALCAEAKMWPRFRRLLLQLQPDASNSELLEETRT
ncbi:type I-E CRISPR-associated protein Cse1/CasA [Halomonas sp. CS7]|uniref:Type I-E CRISPR-associated protein Cse1/CasA n=1 Tax=Halomonas pelophila TaxID=3151122 RepID=A0ABV1N5Q7_9GAMM